jgi:hypothetical protein
MPRTVGSAGHRDGTSGGYAHVQRDAAHLGIGKPIGASACINIRCCLYLQCPHVPYVARYAKFEGIGSGESSAWAPQGSQGGLE